MRIAVASGKGGTGKTTVSIALALANRDRVRLVDCDVEEPNAHLFLPGREVATTEVTASVPRVAPSLCTQCGLCVDFCQYNALAVAGPAGLMVFPELCHDCGGCVLVCPQHALSASPVARGTVTTTLHDATLELVTGRLAVGSPSAPTVIRATIRTAPLHARPVEILDAPPGTACSFATTVQAADFCLFVTDPTPFGLHDMRLALEAIRGMGLPCAAVVNRSTGLDDLAASTCAELGLPILLRIPESRTIAEAYARGGTLLGTDPTWKDRLRTLFDTIVASTSWTSP